MKVLRHFKWIVYAVVSARLLSAIVFAGELVDLDFSSQNYPYSDDRDVYIYVPDIYNGQSPVPMVMVLHGCHQSRDTVLNEFGWDEIADQYGFILVAPDISTDDFLRSPHCWGYWEPKEIHEGQGEVEDLHRIGLQVERNWRIDSNRRHIVGLSSGGFMANAAAVAHNEYWASVGVHSGGGYGESASTYASACSAPRGASGRFKSPSTIAAAMRAEFDSENTIPVMLLHSHNDCSVGYGVEHNGSEWGGLTSNRDAWLAINGGSQYATTDCSRDGIDCRHQKFGIATRSTLEVVSIVGLIQGTDSAKGHYWSGGKTDGQWTRTQGPKAALIFWDFFQRHPRFSCATCPAPPTGLTAVHINEVTATLSWHSNGESDLSGYHLYRNDRRVRPDPIPLTHLTDNNLQRATAYTYYVTAVNTAGGESLPSDHMTITTIGPVSCQSYSSTLNDHVTQNRAYSKSFCSGWWCWFWPWPKTSGYYAVGSEEKIGTDGSTEVTLYSSDGTTYTTTACNDGG